MRSNPLRKTHRTRARTRTRFVALFILALIAHSVPSVTNAATKTGTVIIEQTSTNGVVGEWVLIKPGNKRLTLDHDEHTVEEAPIGNYTLIADPPAGAITTVRSFLGNDLLDSVEVPQISFRLDENVVMRIEIEYNFTRVGIISVNSNPKGLKYKLTGPNDFKTYGRTPMSYPDIPEGQYSVLFDDIENCLRARPLSDRLEKDSRIQFTMTVECEGLEDLDVHKQDQHRFEYVTATIDGEEVVFHDVPVSTWFAPYVSSAVRTNIMSGYRDSRGRLTGEYGPSNTVTLAQLSKIAHELAGIDETRTHSRPSNPRAQDTWFSDYFASAERLSWQVFRDPRLDPGRPATRAEVVTTLLQALDVPRSWPTGSLFTDVSRDTRYSSSIETAVIDGLVSGYTNSDGESTGLFGPENTINRAEMAKIITTAIELYVEGN